MKGKQIRKKKDCSENSELVLRRNETHKRINTQNLAREDEFYASPKARCRCEASLHLVKIVVIENVEQKKGKKGGSRRTHTRTQTAQALLFRCR